MILKKNIKRAFIIFISLIFLFITGLFTNHKYQLKKENVDSMLLGEMIEHEENNFHVYIAGNKKPTLVFMAGGQTSSPTLDFKSLYQLFEEDYQVVVIEKSGYGFSDSGNSSRDVDTMLSETRAILKKANITSPLILFPHSMGAIEALYWAMEYPEEIIGIVGLDIASPKAYENFNYSRTLLNLSAFGGKIGIMRFFENAVNESAAIKNGNLSLSDKELYRKVLFKSTMTKPMKREVIAIKDNAKKVADHKNISQKMLLFISNGEETGWDSLEWINYQKDFVNENPDNRQYIEVNHPHYIHNYEFEKIYAKSNLFIKSLLENK